MDDFGDGSQMDFYNSDPITFLGPEEIPDNVGEGFDESEMSVYGQGVRGEGEECSGEGMCTCGCPTGMVAQQCLNIINSVLAEPADREKAVRMILLGLDGKKSSAHEVSGKREFTFQDINSDMFDNDFDDQVTPSKHKTGMRNINASDFNPRYVQENPEEVTIQIMPDDLSVVPADEEIEITDDMFDISNPLAHYSFSEAQKPELIDLSELGDLEF